MLRRAKTFPADSSVINEALIKALIGEYPLTTQRRAEMSEAIVAKDAIDKFNVVPEIARCSRNQISCRCWRINETSVALGYQPQRFQGCQQSYEPVLRNACCIHERRQQIDASRNGRKKVKLHRGK